MKLVVEGPIRLVSEANQREHWTVRHRRNNCQQRDTSMLLKSNRDWYKLLTIPPPYRVTLTRIGGRTLDPDNLAGSCKHVQDAVAAFLNVDDGDVDRVSWSYQQEKGPVGLRIEIEAGGQP